MSKSAARFGTCVNMSADVKSRIGPACSNFCTVLIAALAYALIGGTGH
jgi:hypothetical protein